MIVTTTSNVEGQNIVEYCGIVTGDVIVGTNIFRYLFASLRDIIGGRSNSYEKILSEARVTAIKELEETAHKLGANAVVSVGLNYATGSGSMMVSASGTAVRLG